MTVAALAPTYTYDGEGHDTPAGPPLVVLDAAELEALSDVERAAYDHSLPSETLVYPANTGGPASFFANATNGVATGRIPSALDDLGRPLWLSRGLCWRQLGCLYPQRYPLDCTDCGADAPAWADATVYARGDSAAAVLAIGEGGDGLLHEYRSRLGHTSGATFDAAEAANWVDHGPVIYGELTHPANRSAKAFEVVFYDKITNGTVPVTAEAMRAHMGLSFGGALWDQVAYEIDSGNMYVPPALAGFANDPSVVVSYLEHTTGFAGEGTLVVPSVLLAYLLDKKNIVERNGRYRTAAGNRVISEGVSIHTVTGGANGTANIAMVGPVDYAATEIVEVREGTRDRGNYEAMKITMEGIVRFDTCSAARGAAVIPASTTPIAEVP